MKKTFGKLFIIFGVLLCIFAFYGCGEEAETTLQSSDITSAEATKSTSETDETTEKVKETTSAAGTTSEAKETSAETTETEAQTVETSETEETSAQTEETTAETEETSSETESFTESVETTEITSSESCETEETVEETTEDPFAIEDELISELVEYLQGLMVECGIADTSISIQINDIKNGAQPLQVKFDSDDYYYVCAYYSPEHDEEQFIYCCAENYTWVRFNSEKDISEYYDGTKLWVAFQINRTELCIDLLPGGRKVPKVENFQLYTPVFVDGVNIASVIEYKDAFIYLNSSDSSAIYFCSTHILHDFNSMPLIELDGKSYITESLYVDTPGEGYEDDIRWRFGEYYDLLMEMMITDKYSVVHKSGKTIYYGLFEIEEFFNMIFK